MITMPLNTKLPEGAALNTPFDRRSWADSTMLYLRDAIVRGTYAPGETLTEVALASSLNVGRGTVRTALLALEIDELVVRKPYSNWAVAPLDSVVIWEVYTMREALEGLAARIVAQRKSEVGGDSDAVALLRAFDIMEKADAGDVDSRVSADLGFHRTLVGVTGHRLLIRRFDALAAKVELLYRWSERHWPRRRALGPGHRDLLDAVLSGIPEQAEAAVREHIELSLREDLAGFAGVVTP